MSGAVVPQPEPPRRRNISGSFPRGMPARVFRPLRTRDSVGPDWLTPRELDSRAVMSGALDRRSLENSGTAPEIVRLAQMMTCAESMKQVFDLVQTAAPTDVNVLVLGENGSGK